LFYVIIPTLFLYFLLFCYPYIFLHFKCFLLLVILAQYKNVVTKGLLGLCRLQVP